MPCSGVSPRSMKPVIRAKFFSGHATLRANRTRPSISTNAANTGRGLSQCVQCPVGQASRILSPSVLISASARKIKGAAQSGQNRYSCIQL